MRFAGMFARLLRPGERSRAAHQPAHRSLYGTLEDADAFGKFLLI
jgi:hypothetical protein